MIYEEIVAEKFPWGNYRTSKAKRKRLYNRPEKRQITKKLLASAKKYLDDGVIFSKCHWTFIPSELTVDVKDKKEPFYADKDLTERTIIGCASGRKMNP